VNSTWGLDILNALPIRPASVKKTTPRLNDSSLQSDF